MWARRSLVVAIAAAFVSGCGGSSNTYSATEVAKALRKHGFATNVQTKDEWESLLTFPQNLPKGVEKVITTRERSAPGNLPALVLEALVFDAQEHASCGEVKVQGTCLRKRNVLVFVRKDRARPAREALAELG